MLSKIGNSFLSFKLNELFLYFRELIDYALCDYIEKSVRALKFGNKAQNQEDSTNAFFRCEVIDKIEAYSQFRSNFSRTWISTRR